MIDNQEQPKTNQNPKKREIIKYGIITLFVFLLAGSLIANIIYIPKYYQQSKYQNQTTNITLAAYLQPNGNDKLFGFSYATNDVTLGDVLQQFPSTFILSGSVHSSLGRYLSAISWNNQLYGDPKHYWQILVNNEQSNFGIDSLVLTNNSTYQINYLEI